MLIKNYNVYWWLRAILAGAAAIVGIEAIWRFANAAPGSLKTTLNVIEAVPVSGTVLNGLRPENPIAARF